ncbi:NPS protein, partial [Locustella ochotensis]|nr:NPS protein [Locustella ochotensis]
SLCRLNLVFILWISMTWVCLGYPVGPSTSTNPFYLACRPYGRWDPCLVLLSSCLSKVGREQEPTLGKPLRDSLPHKRSFRNGVGAGIKKTSFRRAK